MADLPAHFIIALVILSVASLIGWVSLLIYLFRHDRSIAIGLVIAFVFVIVLSLVRLIVFPEDTQVELRASLRVVEVTTMTVVPWGILWLARRRGY